MNFLALAACAEPSPPPAGLGSTCDADRAAALIGKPVRTFEGAARVRSGARHSRAFPLGAPVAVDVRPDRLLVEHDATGRIARLRCG